MKRFICINLLIVILFFAFSGSLFALPRNLEFRTIETEHFRVNYSNGMENIALRMAKLLEQIHTTLSVFLEYESEFKTEVIIHDHTSSPNGLVNVYPYNHMVLYAVPPDKKSVLNDYDDWLRFLITHEHTHVIQLDTKSGITAVLNKIFGGIMHPNQYMPRWYTEGMAIFDETRFTAGGRNRSSIFEMFLRMDTYEDRFLEIDQINGGLSRWPYGHVPYLYGAKFMQYLADKHGEKTFAALGYLYGQRLIPLALNKVLKQATGDTYVRLYAEWKEQYSERLKQDISRLEQLELTKLDYITEHSDNHDSPILFPTGDKILYFHDDAQPYRTGWAVLDIETNKSEIILAADEDGGASIAPDGKRIVTAQMAYSDSEYKQYDLFIHDLEHNESKRLTHHLRAREPAFAPDGRQLAFVQYGVGSSHIMIMDIDAGDSWQPFPAQSFDQVFTPVWSPDSKRLAFTGWRFNDFKDIYIYNFETNSLSRVTNDRNLDSSPTWSPDGNTLYWSSDKSGIYNIYALDIHTKKERQLTNVIGGVFSPAITPDGKKLYVSSYRSHGYDLASINLEQNHSMIAPNIGNLRPQKEYNLPEVEYVEREYSPFPSVYPKFWMPTWGTDHAGTTLGLYTWGNDITGQHSWKAEFDFGIKSYSPSIALSYTNRSFTPSISTRASHVSYTLVDAAEDNGEMVDQDESRTSGSISFSFPFRSRVVKGQKSQIQSHTLSLGLNFNYTRVLNKPSFSPLDSPTIFADSGLKSGLSLGWSYHSRQSYPGFVGSASGRSIYVNVRTSTEWLGADYNNITVTAGYSEYIPNPFIEGHSLALKLLGGMGYTDYSSRQTFYIGGPPDGDVISDLLRNNRVFGTYLRGYEPYSISGNKYFMLKTEYRFVAWNIEKGIYTLPIYFKRVHMAPFFDIGYAWSKNFDLKNMKKGLGGEIRLDLVAAYFTPITIAMGYQVGLDKNGVSSLYFMLDNTF